MTVHVDSRGPIRIVTIDRPSVRNAVDGPSAQAIDEAVRAAEQDESVGAIILTGSGTRAFCSGLDLRQAADHGPTVAVPTVLMDGGFCGITERATSKLLIAAVNGAAVAGGWELALACDLIVASETAYFASNEVSRGMIADGGASIRLPRIVGPYIARELLLTGDPLGAYRAQQLGLVNRVVAPHEVLTAAIGLAERVLQRAPQAVLATRGLVSEAGGLPGTQEWAVNKRYADLATATSDALEGSKAYVEKRDAQWSGR